jgi:hypothetical protein
MVSEPTTLRKRDALLLLSLSLGRAESGWYSEYARCGSFDSSYLVDPASSHMLVSKIKPCMSKYKHLYTVKLRTAHYISYYLFDGTLLHGYP